MVTRIYHTRVNFIAFAVNNNAQLLNLKIIFYPTIVTLKCISSAKTNTPQARVGFYPLAIINKISILFK